MNFKPKVKTKLKNYTAKNRRFNLRRQKGKCKELKNKIYVPIKVSETKGNKNKYNYGINTHGNIRIYASMAT